MNSCNEYLELIGQKLDGCLTPDEENRLEAHLRQCPRCRAALEAYSWIDQGVLNLSEEPPADLHSRIMDAVAQEPRQEEAVPADDPHSGIHALPAKKRRFFFGPGTAMAAVAAVLVLLVGTGKIRLPMNGRTNTASSSAIEYTEEAAAEEAAEDEDRAAATAEFSAAMDEEAGEAGEAAAQAEGTEESASEDASVEEAEAEASEEPETVVSAAEEIADHASADTSSDVHTESLTFGHATDSGLCYDTIYHDDAREDTEILFPDDVDTAEVSWSVSNPEVAYVEDNIIYSQASGVSVIVVRYGDLCEVLTLLVDTKASDYSACLADFWVSGFDLTVTAGSSKYNTADTFLYAEYEEMEAAVYATDWQATIWRYDNLSLISIADSGDSFSFRANWTCTLSEDSVWLDQPLWEDDCILYDSEGEPYATQTVYYTLKRAEDGSWYLAWKGYDDSELIENMSYNYLFVLSELTQEQKETIGTLIAELDGHSEELEDSESTYYFDLNSTDDLDLILDWLQGEGLEYSYSTGGSEVEGRVLIICDLGDNSESWTASESEAASATVSASE